MGFIPRYIMSCANKSGIPDVYIKEFSRLKYRQRNKLYVECDEKSVFKSKILSEERKLLLATLQQVKKISIRKRKLDEIFFK